MQLYFYHRVLLAERTNHFDCCHDLFYLPETPSKRESFTCSLTSYGLYLFHTAAQCKGVVLLLRAGDAGLCDSSPL